MVVTVDPSDVTFDCQSTSTPIENEVPKARDTPLTVIVELASLAFAIEPAN